MENLRFLNWWTGQMLESFSGGGISLRPSRLRCWMWSSIPFWVILLLPWSLISSCLTLFLIHFKPVTSACFTYFTCAVFPLPSQGLLIWCFLYMKYCFLVLHMTESSHPIGLHLIVIFLKSPSLITLPNGVLLSLQSILLPFMLSHLAESIITLFINVFFSY